MEIVVVERWLRPEAAAEHILRELMRKKIRSVMVLCEMSKSQAVGFTVISHMSGCEIESAIRDIRENISRI